MEYKSNEKRLNIVRLMYNEFIFIFLVNILGDSYE